MSAQGVTVRREELPRNLRRHKIRTLRIEQGSYGRVTKTRLVLLPHWRASPAADNAR
jgi:hypothetical protein